MASSLDLSNASLMRDLNDVLSTLIEAQPSFISLFPVKGTATSTKHEWNEDTLAPRQVAYSSATAAVAAAENVSAAKGYFTFATATAAASFKAGDVVRIKGSPETYLVDSVSSANVVIDGVYSQNGGSISAATSLPTGAGVLCYVNHAVGEGSSSGAEVFEQTEQSYNYTQIFRRDVKITNTALQAAVYGRENNVEKQIANATLEIMREINESLVYGKRVQRAAGVAGGMGGLYAFGTELSIDATPSDTASALSLKLINDAAERIVEKGGSPDAIILGPGQKRVLGALMRSQIVLQPSDKTRGGTVESIICDLTGAPLRIVVEPQIADTECWVVDSSGFGLVPFGSRALAQYPGQTQGVDGAAAYILGEYTAEFKNAAARLCRIKELKASSLSIS